MPPPPICLQNDDLTICLDKPHPHFLIQSALSCDYMRWNQCKMAAQRRKFAEGRALDNGYQALPTPISGVRDGVNECARARGVRVCGGVQCGGGAVCNKEGRAWNRAAERSLSVSGFSITLEGLDLSGQSCSAYSTGGYGPPKRDSDSSLLGGLCQGDVSRL